ncbi:FAD-dependent oxidoreductase [Rhizobacter sp. AJA081-3]|uniref:NAD(P)/FAD-dependent oxidoreductase n=1 Tax=Rhizobacter sp. AJA081-3 TaxID=2753607 RepID=UPI001ADF8EF9|nr:FAD-dependent oxidoreductase [Rhizobacter sp. AJA081-3]QTN23550.1 FAD-dependent oxidoreductase [Rhizobacter sp. AJA081-3]
MSEQGPIVIVGGGHAGAQLCHALAGAGLGAQVHLVCDEDELPYQRPPLSKAFLKDTQQAVQLHRAEPWFAEAGITLHRGDAVVSIDRAAHSVRLRSGAVLPYAQLVLATGAVARTLPALPVTLVNVAALRSATDALRLRGLLDTAQQVTVLGGGFIGLEIAATARALGKQVTVLESAPRLLSRSVSPDIAEHVLATHRASGIDLLLGVKVGDFNVEGDRLASLNIDGQPHAVELLVMGIGAAPRTQLALDAGLACDNGIVVDENLRTSDPTILAIGDCACFPEHGSGRRLRLESVQNANDQARTALATLTGQPAPYRALPWFWSEQGSLRLQMAGLMPADGVRHRRTGATPASFSILHYVGERLACVESVNAPLDHMAARKLLETGKSPAPAVACDPAVALKTLA